MTLDRQRCYRALRARDARFDGRFFTAVVTTGIYCRPICPARPPKLDNVQFFHTAAAAHEAGFRPCLRCRPEVSPRFSAWRGTWNSVARALLLIEHGALDTGDVEQLATRLGMGPRHLRRLFDEHLGAPPVAVAQTRRVQLAKQLLDETRLPVSRIAHSAGFGSVRRFNDAMRKTYDRSPRELRQSVRSSHGTVQDIADVTIKLPFTPPYHWHAFQHFLAVRAIPGVEDVTADVYRRTIRHENVAGIVEIRPVPGLSYLSATVRMPSLTTLGVVVERLRHLCDVGADPLAIAHTLSTDARLAPAIRAYPGIRVPGAWDGFELAVRAVLGQQVSVRAATTLSGKFVVAYGTPLGAMMCDGLTHLFPAADTIARLTPVSVATTLGVPRARAAAIVALAHAVVQDDTLLQPGRSLEQSIAALCALPGIGAWTAHYIAMRALREPDAFPAADLVLRQALAEDDAVPTATQAHQSAEAWRPWRAYAAMLFWTYTTTPHRATTP